MDYVAHKILGTAQSPNSSFSFLFDFGLGLGTWELDSGLSISFIDSTNIPFSKTL